MGWRVFGGGRRRNATGGMRRGGQLEVSHPWVSCSVGGGGEGGELSEWEGKGGMGGGEGGANLHFLFYTRG